MTGYPDAIYDIEQSSEIEGLWDDFIANLPRDYEHCEECGRELKTCEIDTCGLCHAKFNNGLIQTMRGWGKTWDNIKQYIHDRRAEGIWDYQFLSFN